MIKNDQKYCNNETGDCLRAALSSLLDYPLEAVPHFALLPPWLQLTSIQGFLWSQGFTRGDNVQPKGKEMEGSGVNGFFMASVPSKTIPGQSHAVVINGFGLVVHDPNPNKKWEGEGLFDGGRQHYVYSITHRDDLEWVSFLKGKKTPEIPKGLAADILFNSLMTVLKLRSKTGCEAAMVILKDYFRR